MKKVQFGYAIPTGTEGLIYPIPYASARDVIEISVYAEELGFDSVWGNDHIQTQQYVIDDFGQMPRYYSPLMELAAIAERTKKVKLGTALLVLPFRHPAVMSKELATLDHISGGRLMLGVGIGAYREEFEAQFGTRIEGLNRGEMLDECVEVMHRLFTEDCVTHEGKYFSIANLRAFPKPLENPFPFYFGGNSPKGYERTVKYGTGWLPAILRPDEVAKGVAEIKRLCEQYGRDFETIDIAPQLGIRIGKTHEEACEGYQKTQLYRHGVSLKNSTMKGKDPTAYVERNLVGTVDEVVNRIGEYMEAGVTNFASLLFANNTLEESREQMQQFAEEVMPKFR